MTDLVARLQEAACAAIAQERPSLEHLAGKVRGLTVELLMKSDSTVYEAVAFVERRTTGPALLAGTTARKGTAA
jgi:hypothetical protein